jgi:F-type H+-transporting ATPase subunit b
LHFEAIGRRHRDSSHTEAPGGHGGFPPFQRDTFASQLVWLLLAFTLLYILMAKVALPRIGSILADRRNRIADDLAYAEHLKRESNAAIAAYEKSLNDARYRAQIVTNERRRQEAAAAKETRQALESQLILRFSESNERIAMAKAAAMANVDSIAADAASSIVERLLGPETVERPLARAASGRLKR